MMTQWAVCFVTGDPEDIALRMAKARGWVRG